MTGTALVVDGGLTSRDLGRLTAVAGAVRVLVSASARDVQVGIRSGG